MAKCRAPIASGIIASVALATAFFGVGCGMARGQALEATPSDISPPMLTAPSVNISNGPITAKIYRADAHAGDFYRFTRFDQTGIVGEVTVRGEKLYGGAWYDFVSPDIHDVSFTPAGIIVNPNTAIMGPVEEYAPVGFENAQPDGLFLKIGVGLLRRPDDKAYDHTRFYDVVDAGKRTTRVTRTAITFIQDVDGAGYGYHYEKTLRLVPGKTQMVIEHVLRNTGTKTIGTSVYDHNFLSLSPGHGNVAIAFAFKPTAGRPIQNELARIEDNRIRYVKALVDQEKVQFPITGFGGEARDYDIRVENTATGAGVRVTGDQPLTRLSLWSIRSVLGIEPYISVDIAPGASKRWAYTYEFTAGGQGR